MRTQKDTIRKVVRYLNNPDEDGGFWLPNIQRDFVWTEEQTCRLFDSILREYPISTLLVWKNKSKIRYRKFIDNYRKGMSLKDSYLPQDEKRKNLVLDGQQRLQSLFIGLNGSYDSKQMYFNILSGDVVLPDDIKYKFEFKESGSVSFPWLRFSDLVFSTDDSLTKAEKILKDNDVSDEKDRSKVVKHVSKIVKTFTTDENITYQELDSIDSPDTYKEDDVVEIFIRANSGGTKLTKSDLLFSLLSSNWDMANDEMDDLLAVLNRHGFAFSRDFILKTCLTLLNMGASYEVGKFRKPDVKENIENSWNDISNAIKDVHDFLYNKTYIKHDKALPSYLALIPLVYTRYHFKEEWYKASKVEDYLLRALLTGSFSGSPDKLIDACVVNIKENKLFNVDEIFGEIRTQNRSLELTESKFWEAKYSSKTIHLIFNLWYKDFDYDPSYDNNLPQVDHIFPQSKLKKIKIENPETGKKNIRKYQQNFRDQLANCMLLSRAENGAGGKGDTLPEVWFADKSEDYLDMHLIPKDKELWKMDNFEQFIVERKKLINAKFKYLLVVK